MKGRAEGNGALSAGVDPWRVAMGCGRAPLVALLLLPAPVYLIARERAEIGCTRLRRARM